jgi:hypothetical protein
LSELRASGSGEFSLKGLKALLARTQGPVTVFDLRQETHVFVNDLPVSWYASHDWANVGRTQAEIEKQETNRVQSFKPGSKIDVRPGQPVKHGNGNSITPQRVTVDHASTEQAVVVARQIHRTNWTIRRHRSRPTLLRAGMVRGGRKQAAASKSSVQQKFNWTSKPQSDQNLNFRVCESRVFFEFSEEGFPLM